MNRYGVYIGRFQPFHNAHLETVRFALDQVEKLIIVVGSDNQATTVKNPWTTKQRINMIRRVLGEEVCDARITFVKAKDYLYNDMLWLAALQESIDEATGGSDDVVLFGHRKDASSFYLKLFPQWQFIESAARLPLDATKIRSAYFQYDATYVRGAVPPAVADYLETFAASPEYTRLRDEYLEVQKDKAAWSGSPYQPTFVTTDAIVICSGHVLVVRRRGKYGRGLVALPGGYIDHTQPLVDNCIRELKEETGIKVESAELKKFIVDKDVFDHPDRDLRGRIITHAYCIKLPDGQLPKVKGMDDADKAWWMSLRDVFASEPRFFADHYHVINRFVTKF